MKIINSALKIIFENIIKEIDFIGSMIFSILSIILFLYINLKLGFVLLISFILIIISILLIRTIYFKQRPDKMQYNNYIEKIDASSFPSLHTARTFMISTFLILLSNNNNMLIIFLLIISILSGYSRIYKKKHDINDVIFGGLLGFIITYSVYYYTIYVFL